MKLKTKYSILLLTMTVSVNTIFVNKVSASVLVAKPSTSQVYINNVSKELSSYNIGGNNYFKIRDLAEVVSGTDKQFNVEWDNDKNAINLVSSKAYNNQGNSGKSEPANKDTVAIPTNSHIFVNGSVADFKSYNIEGNNYFMLRDVMETFDISVTWAEKSGVEGKVIGIDTSKSYEDVNPTGVMGLNAQDIYKKCSHAVFYIETYDMNKNPLYTGSGFFINESGRAVTNFHVLEDAFSAKVYLTDGKVIDIDSVTAFDIEKDLAVFQVKGSDFSYLSVGDSNDISGGEKIYAIGSPLGLDNTISEGVVSNPNRKLGDNRLIQISAPISSGSSGGALINNNGKVIGITSSGMIDGQNLNFAVPIDEVALLDMSGEPITLKDMASEYAIYNYENKPEGFERVVDEGEPNNIISQAGILENGVSVAGFIDADGGLDNFYAACTTKGTVKITCFSDSADISDILLMMNDTKNTVHKMADLLEMDDGSKFVYLENYISEPNDFIISFASKGLFGEKNINTDYVFYYEFVPEV